MENSKGGQSKMVKPKIKTIINKFNTKGEVMDAIKRGKFGRKLYLKYK